MTRINYGIPPRELSDKHLLAEHREIKRIPNMIRNGRAVVENLPVSFTLGNGHVKFFYDKLAYLHKRYLQLLFECQSRGFKVTDFSSAFENLPEHLYNDCVASEKDIEIVRKRILERTK